MPRSASYACLQEVGAGARIYARLLVPLRTQYGVGCPRSQPRWILAGDGNLNFYTPDFQEKRGSGRLSTIWTLYNAGPMERGKECCTRFEEKSRQVGATDLARSRASERARGDPLAIGLPEILLFHGAVFPIGAVSIRPMLLAAAHAAAALVAAGSVLLVDGSLWPLVDDLDVTGEVLFLDGLVVELVAILDQRLSVLDDLLKSLEILFGETFRDVVRQRIRGGGFGRSTHVLSLVQKIALVYFSSLYKVVGVPPDLGYSNREYRRAREGSVPR